MIRQIITTIILGLVTQLLFAQNPTDLNLGIQLYPTGIIPKLKVSKAINEKSAISASIGYNFFDHRDLGVHDEETGSGPGFTLAYRRYLKANWSGWHLNIKNDFWWNTVDWSDVRAQGQTKITVIQPTLEIGYLFEISESIILSPSAAFGVEWNVKTRGAPTGEGPIILVGIELGKRF